MLAPRSACPLYPLRLLRHSGNYIITMLSPTQCRWWFPHHHPRCFLTSSGLSPRRCFRGFPPSPLSYSGSARFFHLYASVAWLPFSLCARRPLWGVFYGATPLCPPPSIPHGRAQKKATCWVALFIRPIVVSPSVAHQGRASLLAACATSFAPGR